MLTSIHPLGERARGQRHGLTVAAHLLGGALGGATTGALLGTVGSVLPADLPVLALAAAVCLLAAVLDLCPGRRTSDGGVPGLRLGRRQVDEDWLTRYRGWVYGAGYGFQLGLGVVTVVTSAATPALLAVLVLLGDPGAAAVVGAVFGAVRGLPLLLRRPVVSAADLRATAVRRERRAVPVSRLTPALLAAGGLLLGASAWATA